MGQRMPIQRRKSNHHDGCLSSLLRRSGRRIEMKKYRIREGSIADYARYGLAGLVFFVGIALVGVI